MPPSDNRDLVLSASCGASQAHTWVLDPQGRNSFRIVVRCRPDEVAAPAKSPSPSLFAAIVHGLVSILGLWRT